MTSRFPLIAARTLAALVLSACGSFSAITPTPAHHFLERSYLVFPPRDTSLIYEGLPAAHIIMADGLPLAYDHLTRVGKDTQPNRNALAVRVMTSVMFRIRQLKDSSAAVRTPSFMPRIIAVEELWAHGLGDPPVVSGNFTYNHLLLSGARLSLTHHSNGQAGCFREGYIPKDNDFDYCVPAPITDPAKHLPQDTMQVKLNFADGDFSSTFVSATLHTTYMYDFSRAETPRWSVGAAGTFDYHPKGIFGALSEDEQRPLYGGWRLHGQVEGMLVSGLDCADLESKSAGTQIRCALRGRTRVTAEGERAPKASGPLAGRFNPAILNWRGSIELSHAFYWALGTGLFIRWNDGQDYYNIGFVNRRRSTMFGLMLDASGPDLLRRRDATIP
jgi:hypothetical protein